MIPAASSPVAAALVEVDEERFVRDERGELVTQSTTGWAIAQILDRLQVRPGMRVLEIGTGSGYSTALLATLVGASGHIVSLDVAAHLVDRARCLLAAAGLAQISLRCADGATGATSDAPFDRVVAWTTPPELPAAWIDQLTPDGLLVAPVALTSLSKTGAGVVIALDGGIPEASALFEAGYVEMHDEVLTQWDVPPYGADAVRWDSRGGWWLSAEHLRNADPVVGDALLGRLISDACQVSGPLQAGESGPDFRGWLLATRPAGLTTAALGTPLWRHQHHHHRRPPPGAGQLGRGLAPRGPAKAHRSPARPDPNHPRLDRPGRVFGTLSARWRRACLTSRARCRLPRSSPPRRAPARPAAAAACADPFARKRIDPPVLVARDDDRGPVRGERVREVDALAVVADPIRFAALVGGHRPDLHLALEAASDDRMAVLCDGHDGKVQANERNPAK